MMDVHTDRQASELQRISRATDAREVALAAYGRLASLLERLEPADWERPTECEGWDVAAMVGHVIGAAEAGASLRQNLRQLVYGKRNAGRFGGNSLDATNDLQVREHADLSPAQRIAALRQVAPAAVDGRLGLPRPLRRIAVPLDAGGSTATGMPSRLRLGELMDVIYTRDVWLHTIDIARATSVTYEPDPLVDGRIVEDVVASWVDRHGAPVRLVLEGPAGGTFRHGTGGVTIQLDAVEFCRILSGRAAPPLDGVGAGAEAATIERLLTTRLVF